LLLYSHKRDIGHSADRGPRDIGWVNRIALQSRLEERGRGIFDSVPCIQQIQV